MYRSDISFLGEPKLFAEYVKNAPNEHLLEMMQSDRRGVLLDEIVHDMPRIFKPEAAGSIVAVVHWKIGDRPDGGSDVYELHIGNGKCRVATEPGPTPRLVLSIGAVDFLKMTMGCASPVLLFMRGKMKAKGDLGLAMKFANLFDIGA